MSRENASIYLQNERSLVLLDNRVKLMKYKALKQI